MQYVFRAGSFSRLHYVYVVEVKAKKNQNDPKYYVPGHKHSSSSSCLLQNLHENFTSNPVRFSLADQAERTAGLRAEITRRSLVGRALL